MEAEIRRAVPADAEAAARCQLTCWREAYAGVVDADRLADVTGDLDGRVERWRHHLAGGADRWVALHPDGDRMPMADRLLGFSASGPCRDPAPPCTLELYSIYVRQAWWGTGLGDRLLRIAVGDDRAVLWVFETNARARAFYARHGFRADGVRKDDPWSGLPELRMTR